MRHVEGVGTFLNRNDLYQLQTLMSAERVRRMTVDGVLVTTWSKVLPRCSAGTAEDGALAEIRTKSDETWLCQTYRYEPDLLSPNN
jgi:hypothetical protein